MMLAYSQMRKKDVTADIVVPTFTKKRKGGPATQSNVPIGKLPARGNLFLSVAS